VSRRQSLQALKSLSTGRAGKLPIIGGRVCLDFVNTSSGRGTAHHKENLNRYPDLLAWAHHAGILAVDETLELAARDRARPAAGRRAFAQALALREALHLILAATVRRRPIPADAVDRLNDFIAKSASAARFEPAPRNSVWHWSTMEPASLDCPLWPIVRSAVELLAEGPLDRLKMCDGVNCGWVFLDQTRNGRRRWCEMEVCGSRAKMRRYRGRQAGAPGRRPHRHSSNITIL
jgi:predicted RNA-binding Zn ribbon-like protein